MSGGPPENAGPPERVDVGGPEDLDEFLATRTPDRVAVQFQRGDESVEEEFVDVDRTRGGGLAELHRDDGRYVTVDVRNELDAIEVSE